MPYLNRHLYDVLTGEHFSAVIDRVAPDCFYVYIESGQPDVTTWKHVPVSFCADAGSAVALAQRLVPGATMRQGFAVLFEKLITKDNAGSTP